jgi:hypothetical protein
MWVLYNVAHGNSKIKSYNGKAWIRVLGFFHSKNKAMEHASCVSKSIQGGLEIRICPIEQFRIILNKKFTMDDMDEIKTREEKKLNFLLKYHKEFRKSKKEEVEINSREKKTGDLFFEPEERRTVYKEYVSLNSLEQNPTSEEPKEHVPIKTENLFGAFGAFPFLLDSNFLNLKKDFHISSQNYFAMAYLPDYEVNIFETQSLDVWKIYWEEHYMKIQTRIVNTWNKKSNFNCLTFHEFSKTFGKCLEDKFGNYEYQFIKNNYEDYIKSKFSESDYSLFKIEIDKEMKDFMKKNPIPEKDQEEEPAIAFLCYGETSQEVHDYITKNKELPLLKEYDVACIALYEWIQLENFKNTSIKKEYREELIKTLLNNRDASVHESQQMQQVHPNIPVIDVI